MDPELRRHYLGVLRDSGAVLGAASTWGCSFWVPPPKKNVYRWIPLWVQKVLKLLLLPLLLLSSYFYCVAVTLTVALAIDIAMAMAIATTAHYYFYLRNFPKCHLGTSGGRRRSSQG